MEKLMYVLCFLLTHLGLSAQQIRDAKMAQAIRWQCSDCIDTTNRLTAKAGTITSITLSNDITDLTSLNISDNKLTAITFLPANLKRLHCTNNLLTSLPTLPKNLTILYCDGNKLNALPNPLPQNLVQLVCSNNNLYDLPRLPATLENFYCSYNNLSLLPPLPFLLKDMGCSNNRITELPLLPKDLLLLSCFNNPMTCLPILPDSLKFLEISNPINCLPNAVKDLTIFVSTGTSFVQTTKPVCAVACGVKTGLNDVSLTENIRIYPTITEGVLTIETAHQKIDNVAIFNRMGQKMLELKDSVVDLSAFSSGLYLVFITVGGERVMKKVVKL
jgi:Secretion system C-terminal sorting domain